MRDYTSIYSLQNKSIETSVLEHATGVIIQDNFEEAQKRFSDSKSVQEKLEARLEKVNSSIVKFKNSWNELEGLDVELVSLEHDLLNIVDQKEKSVINEYKKDLEKKYKDKIDQIMDGAEDVGRKAAMENMLFMLLDGQGIIAPDVNQQKSHVKGHPDMFKKLLFDRNELIKSILGQQITRNDLANTLITLVVDDMTGVLKDAAMRQLSNELETYPKSLLKDMGDFRKDENILIGLKQMTEVFGYNKNDITTDFIVSEAKKSSLELSAMTKHLEENKKILKKLEQINLKDLQNGEDKITLLMASSDFKKRMEEALKEPNKMSVKSLIMAIKEYNDLTKLKMSLGILKLNVLEMLSKKLHLLKDPSFRNMYI